MVTPIPFLLFSFLRAWEIMCTYSTVPLPSRGPTTYMQCNKGSIPFSREAIEGTGNMYNVRINQTPFF